MVCAEPQFTGVAAGLDRPRLARRRLVDVAGRVGRPHLEACAGRRPGRVGLRRGARGERRRVELALERRPGLRATGRRSSRSCWSSTSAGRCVMIVSGARLVDRPGEDRGLRVDVAPRRRRRGRGRCASPRRAPSSCAGSCRRSTRECRDVELALEGQAAGRRDVVDAGEGERRRAARGRRQRGAGDAACRARRVVRRGGGAAAAEAAARAAAGWCSPRGCGTAARRPGSRSRRGRGSRCSRPCTSPGPCPATFHSR